MKKNVRFVFKSCFIPLHCLASERLLNFIKFSIFSTTFSFQDTSFVFFVSKEFAAHQSTRNVPCVELILLSNQYKLNKKSQLNPKKHQMRPQKRPDGFTAEGVVDGGNTMIGRLKTLKKPFKIQKRRL